MEVHQLRYFCAVVRAGSFTRAAEQLGIAQPSLSQQIRALEKQVGMPLFERLGRSVRLTPHGEALRQPAMEILQQIAAVKSSLANMHEGIRGKLRIGVVPTIMPYLIAPRIGEFIKHFPEVDLQFVEELTPGLLEGLQVGDIDVAVTGLPVRNPDVVCCELLREPLFLLVSQHHELARKDSVALSDLKNERFLLLKEGHCLRNDVLVACTRARAELNAVFETNHLESIFQLVRASFGLTLVPAMAASLAQGCTLVPLSEPNSRRIGYLRARRHAVSRPMREFITWLRTLTASENAKNAPACA
ncbi:MAG TPA: LysR family transcriptional regulator [Candidatus Angelobacter sp.]|nr:LysR family transcriptional regulator [Candidatus Angelobacter sp.]